MQRDSSRMEKIQEICAGVFCQQPPGRVRRSRGSSCVQHNMGLGRTRLTSGNPHTILLFSVNIINGAAIALPAKLPTPNFHAFSRSRVRA